MTWTAPATWAADEVVTAAKMNTHVRDNLKAIGDAWTSYVPSWTATTTNPTLGNGTLTGKYLQAGKLVIFRIELTIGSTTTAGSGVYSLSLPVATAHSTNAVLGGGGLFFDTSAANHYMHVPYIAGGAVRLAASAARWTATVPVAPATDDVISVSGSYEAA